MNLFKRLFFTKRPDPVIAAAYDFSAVVSQRHKAVMDGDSENGFYVEKDACTACGAPEAEAPGLIEHNVGSGECYFKTQPKTDDEIGQAINAVMVSCVDALRYGGKDENILKRMYELGLSGNCDYAPAGSYGITIRNVVVFYFPGTLNHLAEVVTSSFVNNARFKVIDFLSDRTGRFSFVIRLVYLSAGKLFICTHLENGFFKIVILEEDGQLPDHLTGYSDALHTILKENVFATNILWYDGDAGDVEGAPRPW